MILFVKTRTLKEKYKNFSNTCDMKGKRRRTEMTWFAYGWEAGKHREEGYVKQN